MKATAPQYDVGVIVARFQVHELHEGHRELIQHVCDAHDKVIIVLGLSELRNTINNPLDFEARKQMVLSEFPDVNVLYIMDMQLDSEWSKQLDRLIKGVIHANQSVVLYGSRDSFLDHYEGKYPTELLEASRVYSGTATRRKIASSSTRSTADFRAGAVWAAGTRFPTAFQTVDIAIFNEDYSRLLLCRKPNYDKYQFVGGFSDPRSESLELDALREVREETTLEVGGLRYVGSTRIDDWRYRSEVDCIKTALFIAKVVYGSPRPQDDIEEVRWFDWAALNGPTFQQIMPAHQDLVVMVADYLNRQEA